MMAMQIYAAACSNKGCVRKNNEDNFFLNGRFMQKGERDNGGLYTVKSTGKALYAVCDGMGGEEAGEEASLLSVQLCERYLDQQDAAPTPETLREFLHNGCEEVLAQAEKNDNHSGSTVSLMIAYEGGLYAANMGDSRIYRLTANRMEQVSEDHTEVQRLLRQRAIKEEDIPRHPKRHMILQYWGMPLSIAPFQPFVSRLIPCVSGEKYLLCSDGLTDMVGNDRIEQILRQRKNVDSIAQELVQEALHNGGRDNVTVVILEIRDEDGTVPPQDKPTVEPKTPSSLPKNRQKSLWLSVLIALLAADGFVLYHWIRMLMDWIAH